MTVKRRLELNFRNDLNNLLDKYQAELEIVKDFKDLHITVSIPYGFGKVKDNILDINLGDFVTYTK